MIKPFLLLTLIVTVLVSCAGMEGMTTNVNIGTDAQKKAALKNKKSHDSNKTTVYIFISSEAFGTKHALNIFVDRIIVAKIKEDNFTRLELNPGKHEFHLSFNKKIMTSDHVHKNSKHPHLKDIHLSMSKIINVPRSSRGPMIIPIVYEQDSQYYFHWFRHNPRYGSNVVDKTLEKFDYIPPLVASPNDFYASRKDKDEWELYANTTSIPSLDNFVNNNRNSPFLNEAKTRRKKLLLIEKEVFKKVSSTNSLSSYSSYLEQFPQAHNRNDVYKLMTMKMKKKSQFKLYANKHDEIVDFYPDNIKMDFKLMAIGPSEMSVQKVLNYHKEGLGVGTLSAKIMATNAAYKDFSIKEIIYLKKRGLHEKLIEAMINTNTEHKKQMKLASQNKDMMLQIKELIKQSQVQVKSGSVSGEDKNMPVECLKLKAALSACKKTSGFLAMACKTTARSSFSCNINID
ncbi:hypothetical protein A9Q84_03265 [Halobacteriovorax marinus]|uniref:Lipoprotein n=1 Tax=Halobacteriovorax marinus TaxID=97084 RepID=A0A1Y5FGL2_9BACT|nr:hypothetical protein A9Q84_03265 [Halobacteriovorax marinus]